MTSDIPTPAEGNAERELARPSTAFERRPGNVFVVPDDGSLLEDVSERPAIIAPVEKIYGLED